MKNVFIAGYVRSPFHFAAKGALTRVRPDDMLAAVIQGLLQKTGVPGADIEDLIVGCAMPEGEQGLNVARLTGLLAGLPISVAGTTVNRWISTGMLSASASSSETAYLTWKVARSFGMLVFDNQARV